jgi:hypothetical protein
MARRVELGAGIAAGVLSITALLMLLFAPLVPYCPHAGDAPCAHVRYASLLQTGLDTAGWAYLLGMVALLLIGSAGAIVEARKGLSLAAVPVWIVALLAFGGCAFAARGAGLVYMPAVLALCLAAFASLLQRMRAWSADPAESTGPTESSGSIAPAAATADSATSSNRSG